MKQYDVIIVGSGPAGLTAGLYCGRAKLRTLILEKENLGGAIINADIVENWPGVEDGIAGAELAGNALSQVMRFDVDLESAVTVDSIEGRDDEIKIVNSSGGLYHAKALIISGGTRPKNLGIPGEEHLIHKGISYCVMCDGTPFAGKSIAILGGGNTGVSGALYMGRLGCAITLIEATDSLSASKVLQDRLTHLPNVTILCSTVVKQIDCESETKILRLRNNKTNELSTLHAAGVFILAGREPETEYLKRFLELDEWGFITVNLHMETSVPGVFAAGDIRSGSAMQAIAAAGDGATAAIAAERYINTKTWQ